MKTLTEFDGFRLRNALKTKQELVASGKTPEELPAALGEALKLEGDKLTMFLAALEIAEQKSENLKRVVVFTAEEGKPLPKGAAQKEDKAFLAEFFFAQAPQQKRGREDREGGRGGKRGRGSKRGERGGRGGRGGRGRPDEQRAAGEARAAEGPGGEKRGRGPRPPRGNRPAQAAGAKPNVKPNPTPTTPSVGAPAEGDAKSN